MTWLWPALFVMWIIASLLLAPLVGGWLRRRARNRQDRKHYEALQEQRRNLDRYLQQANND